MGTYDQLTNYFAQILWPLLEGYFGYMFAGVGVTLLLTAIGVGIGSVLGTLIALGRLSRLRLLNKLASGYVTFFRGTPLMVQLLLIYMGLPFLLGRPIGEWPSAIIGLGLNSAAYVAEIVRAGIQSVDRGQREAGLAIGLPPSKVMRLIVLPQAFRKILPALGNEFIALLKDSSLVSVISLEDLMRRSDIVVTVTYRPLEIYAMTALLYLVMTSVIGRLVGRVERRLALDVRTQSRPAVQQGAQAT